MSNTNLTMDMITREAIRIAHEKAKLLGTVDRQYDDQFAKTGGKIGSTLRIREPNKFTRRTGSRVMNVQDVTETAQTLTVATQDGVDMRFNSAELAMDLDDFSKRYIEPAVSVLVSGIESDVMQAATKLVYNSVGTPGTVPASLLPFMQARAKMNIGLAPKDSRYVQMSSLTGAAFINGVGAYTNAPDAISKQYKEGVIARLGGFDFYENERTYSQTCGADMSGTVNDGSIAEGVSTLTMSSFTPAVGDVFTIAAVYSVHPETKVSTGDLQQFVCTAISGNDVTFSPACYAEGVNKNVNALPITAAATTGVGTASNIYNQDLAYHKEFMCFVTADLPLMDDAHKCVRKSMDGLSMRVWQASDIRNDELLTRIDILYGYKVLRPEWACRITS